MKSSTASVSSSDSIPKTAKINLCPSSIRMSVPPVDWRSLAYTVRWLSGGGLQHPPLWP